MVQVSADLARYIRKENPNAKITMTNKQASKAKRKKYYVEETRLCLSLIKKHNDELLSKSYVYGQNG